MDRDGGLILTLENNDGQLTIKAETDSIVPKVMAEKTETVARKTLEIEREEKPPDKVSWWQCTKGVLLEMGIALLICIVAWKLFVGYVRRE